MATLKIPGIYKIQSICKPERFYIGSSINLNERKGDHFKDLKKNNHHNKRLQNHYNKYGKDDLIFIILEPCFPEFLLIREQYYIDKLKPYFNICKKAGNCLGCHWKLSDETKKKMKISKTEEHKKNISEALKGRISPTKGTKQSLELRQRRSEIMKGKKYGSPTKETILKRKGTLLINTNGLGYKHSLETKKKISESKKGKYKGRNPWNKGLKTGLIPWNKGKKGVQQISEETRKKMSESQKRYRAMTKAEEIEAREEIMRLLERDLNDPELNILNMNLN